MGKMLCLNSLAQKSVRMSNIDRFVVISDIHGNIYALRALVHYIRQHDISNVLILGDVLTYGCDPNAVIELLKELQSERRCIFIKGNHDQFYFDLANGEDPFSYKMPDFVKESVKWTYSNCRYNLWEEFEWVESHYESGCFFAHANPFEYGNWRYINNADDHLLAAEKLSTLDYKIAFFGHTHRQKIGVCSYHNNGTSENVTFLDINEKHFTVDLNMNNSVIITNTGSVGQPRGGEPSFIVVSVFDAVVNMDIIGLSYDISPHLEQINQSDMSLATRNKLISYFR